MSSGPWSTYARAWQALGAPMRPSPEDVAAAERAVAAWDPSPRGPRALLLGVTPELATMRWPRSTSLVAVDRSEAMLGGVWPASGLPERAEAIQGEWCALPLDDASVDVVVADGSLSVLRWPDEYLALRGELARVIRPGGRFVARMFLCPTPREDLSAIERDLSAGRIGSFHALKWRLVHALAGSDGTVRLGDVWDAWNARGLEPLARAWPSDVVRTIDAYRASDTTYSFPDLDAVRALLAPRFDAIDETTPTYELGERCPTVVWTRR